MKNSARLTLAAALVLAAGAIRLPVEQAMTAKFRGQGLLEEPLPMSVKDKIGQNGLAISLGGLRTLVATFVHLQAYDHFSKLEWSKLEESMETTVGLAPRSRYYWDLGAWHMAKNAASYYWTESDLPPLRAQMERRVWIRKGRDFMERGVQYNPRSPLFYISLARLYDDDFIGADDAKATIAYRKALDLGADIPSFEKAYTFSLARDGSDPATALARVDELMADPHSRVPTVLCLKFALTARLHPETATADAAVRLFGTPERAERLLHNYYTDVRERFPLDGVEKVLRVLEARRGLPPEDPRSAIHEREQLLENLLR